MSKNGSTTIDRSTLEQLRERMTSLRAMSARIPRELSEAEAGLAAAKAGDRIARSNAVRVRALADVGEASQGELNAVEHAARLAGEDLRAAEDRLETVCEKMPAIAAAFADVQEKYRAERLPALREATTLAVSRIDRAFTELVAAFAAGEPLADEIKRDFGETANVMGYTTIDARLPYTLPGVLTFGHKKRLAALAEQWQNLRARG
jgi:hypothetical protein